MPNYFDPRTMQRPGIRRALGSAIEAVPFTAADEALIEAALNMNVKAPAPQGPDRYDVKVAASGGRILTPEEQLKAAKAREAARVAGLKARYFENMQYLSLLAQSITITTEVTSPTSGDDVEAYYKPIFTNTTNGAVRVQVFADFVNPGVGCTLSLTQDASDVGKVDELALVANGKTESIGVILMPTFSLWIRDRDAAFFPMQATDTVRVRVFDPAKLLAYDNLYPLQK